MSSRDSVGSPVRRTSWTGALGAKLGRILSPADNEREEVYVTLPGGAEAAMARRGRGGKVVVGKEGGE